MADSSNAPLLQSRSSYGSTDKTSTRHDSIDSEAAGEIHPSRDVEDDVLPETSTIGRNLSWQSAYILVISRVVGSGIFATPGTIVQSVGSAGLSLSLWIVGAFIAACGLAVSLEFGCMLPRSGGDKVYLEFAYRRPRLLASTLFAMYAVLLGFTASNCIIFSKYALFALGVEATDVLSKSLAVGLLTFVCITHSVFPKAGVKIQDVLGWIKIGIIVFMILSGFYVVIFRPDTSTAPLTHQLAWEHLWEETSWNWGVIATSLFKVFYSFAGLDNAANVMNEVKQPVRTLRSVALTALGTACGLYMLVNIAYFLVVPIEEIRGSGELIAALFFERLFGEKFGRVVLPTAVALSSVGNVMVVAFAMARMKQEIARQGFLPYSSLLSSSRPFNSPMGGFIIHYIPSFLVMILPPSDSIYSLILDIDGYAAQLIGLAVAIGLVKLRFQRPDLKRPFKAWMPAEAYAVPPLSQATAQKGQIRSSAGHVSFYATGSQTETTTAPGATTETSATETLTANTDTTTAAATTTTSAGCTAYTQVANPPYNNCNVRGSASGGASMSQLATYGNTASVNDCALKCANYHDATKPSDNTNCAVKGKTYKTYISTDTGSSAAPVCTNYIPLPNAPSTCGKQGKVSCRSTQKLGQATSVTDVNACGKLCGTTLTCKTFSYTPKFRSTGGYCQLYSAPLAQLSFTPCNTGVKFYDLDTCYTCSNAPTPTPPATCSKYVPAFEKCAKDTHCGTRGEICQEEKINVVGDASCLENCAKSCIDYGKECKYFSYQPAFYNSAAKCTLYKSGKINKKSTSWVKFYEQDCFKCQQSK
ncbi:hypothetical protein FPRO04_09263 [Fusarium proliferatum]|nr:hypothetical protein FPRO04_09263 [Fusarium proliferatum]